MVATRTRIRLNPGQLLTIQQNRYRILHTVYPTTEENTLGLWFERFGSVENTSWCPPPQFLLISLFWLFWVSSGTCSGPGHDSCSRGTSRMRTPVSWTCPQPSLSISRTILPILPNTMMKENIIEYSFYAGNLWGTASQGCWTMPHHAGVGDLNSN